MRALPDLPEREVDDKTSLRGSRDHVLDEEK
jgi:hypothetical protein